MTPPEPDDRPEHSTPRRIGGRYRLEERIGVGAMGAVWRGTDELLNRSVAIKELLAVPAEVDGDVLEESRQRLLREGRIGARLQHPHVISMFDVVVHDERPWLIMEYLPSRSLAAVLAEKGPLPPRDVAAVGEQVADGLAAAHAAGVVHRDVKPGNVLIGDDGITKITDFGVSRAVDDVQLTRTGMIAGTPAFLAPEVARGGQPTAASDVFALGATLYAAVEGEPPFGLDDNAYALLHKVATGTVRPPVASGPLTPVLARLLAIEPDQRPSASQARAELAAVAAGATPADAPSTTAAFVPAPAIAAPALDRRSPTLPGVATPAPTKGAPPAPRRRRALIGLLVALAVLVVAAGVVIGVLRSSAGSGEQAAGPPPAITSAAAPSPPPTTTTAPPTTTPTTTPAPTTTATAPAGGAAAVGFVQRYYSLLPGNPDAAFALLGPQAQAASGGLANFRAFYAGMSAVRLESARATGDDTVAATVVFTRTDGTTSREPYRFVVGQGPDGPIMTSFSRG